MFKKLSLFLFLLSLTSCYSQQQMDEINEKACYVSTGFVEPCSSTGEYYTYPLLMGVRFLGTQKSTFAFSYSFGYQGDMSLFNEALGKDDEPFFDEETQSFAIVVYLAELDRYNDFVRAISYSVYEYEDFLEGKYRFAPINHVIYYNNIFFGEIDVPYDFDVSNCHYVVRFGFTAIDKQTKEPIYPLDSTKLFEINVIPSYFELCIYYIEYNPFY